MITKEAIEAAMDAYREGMYLTDDQALASVTSILTAAFAATPGPAVKKLERMEDMRLSGELPSPSPFVRSVGADLINKIAQVATSVSFQAGEPAMEIAGMIVSSLVSNPENIDRFMFEGTELLLDGTINFENGSLTYRAVNGSILSPSALRQKKGQQQ